MKRRGTSSPAPDSAAGRLLAAERAAEAAGNLERLAIIRSYLSMLRAADWDPDIADLFAVYAGEDAQPRGSES